MQNPSQTRQENGPSRLIDQFGRRMDKLRISVIDRCNFRCQYCMPAQGLEWLPRSEILSFEEILRLARLFTELGISEIRLTGGEPLVRKDLAVLIAQLGSLPLKKLALTTNGYFLGEQIDTLYQAGLRSINLSLDSLIAERFHTMTRRDVYAKVMSALEGLGTYPELQVKINVVVMQGFNADEGPRFAALARNKGISVRFIEFMPLGKEDGWHQQAVLSGQAILADIMTHYPLEQIEAAGPNPASRWRFQDGAPGEIGFINSVSEPFCGSCNRIRLTADGQLRNCLFALQEADLKTALRKGLSDQEIKALISAWVYTKEAGHLINSPDFQRPARSMSQIGG